ncbi:S66 peptidase family protein [Peribacillus kribbensis]|uniref:S66 peptidase family protein n=1 Tax=Peribacillus kribbensis TaxID=356658 RepID=UPI0004790EED|nr:LD-carboxypeptidase [Peribacillus kribbensis]
MSTKPVRLKKGDTVGIIAPASPPDSANLKRALSILEHMGLKVKLGSNLKREYGYLAGSDEERLEDLHNSFLDPEIKGIICACGGYGTGRLASSIDFGLIKDHPKIFWGYSDITFLHTAIYQNTGLVTFHGPMPASDIGKEDADDISKSAFRQLFEPAEFIYSEKMAPLETIVEGEAKGILTGGNLSLLASGIGTAFEIDTKGKLLLIEDVNEEPRAVDRMLNQLYMAGKLDAAAGIVVGDFHNCVPQREKSLSLDEVLDFYIKRANKPALKGFLIGHCSPHYGVPLGVPAFLDTRSKTLAMDSGVQ